jgi:hypothetical protein
MSQKKEKTKGFLVLDGYAVFVTQPSVQRFKQIIDTETLEKGTLERREEVRLVSKRIERRIKNLSQQWFTWQKKNCVSYGLTEGGVGLRLLPFNMKKEFTTLMAQFEREYDSIQKELDKWATGQVDETDEFSIEDVRKTLEGRGKVERSTSFNIRNIFEYNIVEIRMSPVYVKEGPDEAKKIAKKNAEWIIKSINKNLYEIMDKIRKAGTSDYKPKIETMQKALNEVKSRAEAWDVMDVYGDMFDLVETSIHAATAEGDLSLSKEQVEAVAKNLAKGLGVEYEGDPYKVLDKIDTLKKGITPREESFLESLM